MNVATVVGSNVVQLPAVALVALLALRRGHRRAAIVLVANTIVVLALVEIVKCIVARERPHLFAKIALPTDHSFPSGHAMAAVGVYGVVAAVLIALYPRTRTTVAIAAIALAASIGLSRVVLGVHWPSDVIGGLVGGVAPLAISAHLLHRGSDGRPTTTAASKRDADRQARAQDGAQRPRVRSR